MGTSIREIVLKKEIGFEELKGRILVVDSYNILYQFLSSIRQMDGSPLKDAKGNITSHLTGLFSRTARLMGYGIKLAFAYASRRHCSARCSVAFGPARQPQPARPQTLAQRSEEARRPRR